MLLCVREWVDIEKTWLKEPCSRVSGGEDMGIDIGWVGVVVVVKPESAYPRRVSHSGTVIVGLLRYFREIEDDLF